MSGYFFSFQNRGLFSLNPVAYILRIQRGGGSAVCAAVILNPAVKDMVPSYKKWVKDWLSFQKLYLFFFHSS